MWSDKKSEKVDDIVIHSCEAAHGQLEQPPFVNSIIWTVLCYCPYREEEREDGDKTYPLSPRNNRLHLTIS
ncbi:unnamed protein product [Allacma fusca]|uniref:Uncharacterized protein n=1 Tax=Allacma fusca TaxID=39272 RepID=A0A8J2PB67_9HEXA|nr:unnamed protein product [Allacma fusca]